MGIEQLAIFWVRFLAACFLIIGTLYVVSGMLDRSLSGESASVRWSAIIVTGLWISSAGFHALMVTGLFNIYSLALTIACLIGGIRFKGYTFSKMITGVQNDFNILKQFIFSQNGFLRKIFLGILGIGVSLVAARVCLLPPLSWDALTYHVVKADMWVQTGKIRLMDAPGGWSYYRDYPGGAESLQSLSILPFHSNFPVGLVDLALWISLIPALFLLGRCIGLSRESSFIGSIFCMFLPVTAFSVGSCYVDLTLTLVLIFGLSFASLFCLNFKILYLILCFMALGIAGGIKYFAYAPMLGIAAVLSLQTKLAGRINLRTSLAFLTAFGIMLIPIVPWFVYNLLGDNHSLFPFSVNFAGYHTEANNPMISWYFDRPKIVAYDLKKEAGAIFRLFIWPWWPSHGRKLPNWGIMGLFSLCIFPVTFVSIIKRNLGIAMLMGTLMITVLITYFSPGFSIIRLLWAEGNSRFLYGVVLPATIATPLMFRGVTLERYLDFLLFVSCVHLALGGYMYWQSFEIPYLALGGALLTIGSASIVFSIINKRNIQGILVSMAIFLFCFTGIYLARDHIRAESLEKSYFFHDFPRYWVDAIPHIDDDHFPRRIAMTSGPYQNGDNWFMCLFMGKTLKNSLYYVPVSTSGKVLDFTASGFDVRDINYESWLKRLKKNRITEVMSFLPESLEVLWMVQHPENFRKVTGNERYGLFHFMDIH